MVRYKQDLLEEWREAMLLDRAGHWDIQVNRTGMLCYRLGEQQQGLVFLPEDPMPPFQLLTWLVESEGCPGLYGHPDVTDYSPLVALIHVSSEW